MRSTTVQCGCIERRCFAAAELALTHGEFDLIWLDICKGLLVNVAQCNFCACCEGEAGFASDCM